MGTAEVRARAKFDNSEFLRGITGMGSAVSGFVGQVSALAGGYLSVNFLKGMAMESVKLAGTISDLAQRARLTTDQFQALSYAFRMTGESEDDAVRMMERLVNAQAAALSGNKNVAESFATLGIGMKQLVDMDAAGLFVAVAGGMKAGGYSGADLAAAVELIGEKAVGKALPALKAIADGFDLAIAKAREMGQVMEKDVVKKLDEAGDRWDRFYRRVTVAAGTAVVDVADFWEMAFKSPSNTSGGMFGSMVAKGIQGMVGRIGETPESGPEDPEKEARKAAVEGAQRQAADLETKKRATEIQRAQEAYKAAELRLWQQQASLAEQIAAKEREIAELRAKRPTAETAPEYGSQGYLDMIRNATALADAERERADLVKKAADRKAEERAANTMDKNKQADDVLGNNLRVSEWQRIGGGVGGEVGSGLRIAERTLNVNEKILDIVQSIKDSADAKSADFGTTVD